MNTAGRRGREKGEGGGRGEAVRGGGSEGGEAGRRGREEAGRNKGLAPIIHTLTRQPN